MYCGYCGSPLPEDSKYCGCCGRSVTNTADSGLARKDYSDILRMICGVLLIIGGILPYIVGSGDFDYSLDQYGTETFLAINCLVRFFSYADPVFCFSASAISVIAGIALLQRRAGAGKLVVASALVHLISIAYSGISLGIARWKPGVIVSLFTSKGSIVAAAEALMQSENELYGYLLEKVSVRLAVSGVIAAAVFVMHRFLKRGPSGSVLFEKTERPVLELLIMMPILACFFLFSKLIESSVMVSYGTYAVGASSVALDIVQEVLNIPYLYFLFMLVASQMLFCKMKYWKIALATTGVTVLCGMIAYGFVNEAIREQEISTDIRVWGWSFAQSYLLGMTVMVVAVSLWIISVARGEMTAWWQAILSVGIFVVFAVLEGYVKTLLLRMNPDMPMGYVGTALLVGLVSVAAACRACCKEKKEGTLSE